MSEPTPIRKHTTHFNDCGCLTHKHQAIIKDLLEAGTQLMTYKTDGGNGICGGSKLRNAWENLGKAISRAQENTGESR